MESRTTNNRPESFSFVGNEMRTVEANNLFYDENGNLTTGRKDANTPVTLAYNWDNKLRSASINAEQVMSVKYDPMGNRVYKSSVSSAGSVARKYIVDVVGDLPVILLEIDPADMSVKKAYIYANSQIVAQYDSANNKYYYLHDRLGSVRQMINQNGAVVKLYTYNPFGETIEEQGTIDNDFKFTGQYFDKEIGQYYLRARQYSPYLSRFTGRDLIAADFNEPLTLHRYLYCFNNPINRIDPWGLDAYLIYLPNGGPDWLTDLLGEDPGHIEVAVDTDDGKVMVGSAGYGSIFKPSRGKTLEENLEFLKKIYGNEVYVMRFKKKTFKPGVTSDQKIYEYINNGLGKDMIYPYCSRFSYRALAYGGYSLGESEYEFGLLPSELWNAAVFEDIVNNDVSLYSKGKR